MATIDQAGPSTVGNYPPTHGVNPLDDNLDGSIDAVEQNRPAEAPEPQFGSLSRTGGGPQTSGNAARDTAVVDDAAGGASKAVYGKNGDTFTSGGPLPEDKRTWNKVSDADLQKLGLNPALLKDDPNFSPKILGTGIGSTGYKAALYKSDRGEYILAYAGTNPGSLKDLWTDAKGGAGLTPKQFERGMEAGKQVKSVLGDNVVFTGHSLGGGLANYAAIGTNTPSTVFNPMDLSRNLISSARTQAKTNAPDSAFASIKPTWGDWGGVGSTVQATQNPNQGMRQYVARGEFLEGAQSGATGSTGKAASNYDPFAFNDTGQKITVEAPAGDKTGMFDRHSLDFTRPLVAQKNWSDYAASAPTAAANQTGNSSLAGYYPAPTPGAAPTPTPTS